MQKMQPLKPLNIASQTVIKGRTTRAGMRQDTIAKNAREIERREKAEYHADAENAYKPEVATQDSRARIIYDENQLAALRLLVSNQYACVSGPAGTGKTTIMAGFLPFVKDTVGQCDWGAARSAGAEPSGERRPSVALGCFTNQAAQNLASKLPEEWRNHCMSIHSILAFAPVRDQEEAEFYKMAFTKGRTMFEPRYHKANKLPYDVIIIDEAGIVGKDLWHQLLDACKPDCRIYLLGDLYQLKAINGPSPLPFAMHAWPTAFLSKIYRQADGSPIITQAHNIRRGIFPDHVKAKFLCGQMETLPDATDKAQRHVNAYIQHLFKNKLFDPAQDIILTPQNGTSLGQESWNERFHFLFNPPRRDPNTNEVLNPPILIKTALAVTNLCVGDKVMGGAGGGRKATETRLNNGAIGIITAIYPNPAYNGSMEGLGEIEVGHVSDVSGDALDALDLFSATQEATGEANAVLQETLAAGEDSDGDNDKKARAASHIVEITETATGDKHVLSRSAEIAGLRRAYASTCHKFQGSQARRVVVLVHSTFMSNMLSREWLYTAVTRAQEAVILLHDRAALTKCLTRQELAGASAMEKAERLTKQYTKNRPWNVPRLPEPSTLPVSAEALAAIEALGQES